MPTNKDFKRLVRQRMAETAERYTEARAALTGTPDPAPPARSGVDSGLRQEGERLIGLLGDPLQNEGAFRLLKELPPEQLRPLATKGTRHPSSKVRRRSCQLLDDLALTPQTLAALEACTSDPDPRVRAAALHTLACEHCKPDGVCLDPRTIAERAANDTSAKVRRGVAMTLSWNPKHSDEWAIALATRLLADPSNEIRTYAQAALDRIERQRRTNNQRQLLPEPLRTKTDRHPGKWVAILDGNIAAVNPAPSWRWRHPEAELYFVAASGESEPRNDPNSAGDRFIASGQDLRPMTREEALAMRGARAIGESVPDTDPATS